MRAKISRIAGFSLLTGNKNFKMWHYLEKGTWMTDLQNFSQDQYHILHKIIFQMKPKRAPQLQNLQRYETPFLT